MWIYLKNNWILFYFKDVMFPWVTLYIDMSDQVKHSELLLKESGSSAIYLSTLFVNFKKTYRLHHSHCAFHVALKIINTLWNRNIYITKKYFVKEISHFDVATSSYIYKYTMMYQSHTAKLYYIYYCIIVFGTSLYIFICVKNFGMANIKQVPTVWYSHQHWRKQITYN